jgi:hypothetical protein
MKLSVRSKVANGLVICLIVPRIADTAVETFDTLSNLDSFAADDEFEITVDKSNFAVTQVQANPAGADPSGGCDPSGAVPTLYINAPEQLVTAEDGSADLVEVSMGPAPESPHFFQVAKKFPVDSDPSGGDPSGGVPSGGVPSGSDSGGALPVPNAVVFDQDYFPCTPKSIWVVGQNGGRVDGDAEYNIEIRDGEGSLLETVPGINYDNDNYTDLTVRLGGPNALSVGDTGMFWVVVENMSKNTLKGNLLLIEPTPGLEITSFVAALWFGDSFKSKGKIKDGILTFDKVTMDPGEVLEVSVEAVLNTGGPDNQKITARFSKDKSGIESDDDHSIRTALP